MDIGSNIKRFRKAKNLTQEELAMKIDVSRSLIAQIERNYTSPSVILAYQIARVLEVDMNELVKE